MGSWPSPLVSLFLGLSSQCGKELTVLVSAPFFPEPKPLLSSKVFVFFFSFYLFIFKTGPLSVVQEAVLELTMGQPRLIRASAFEC